MTGTGSLFVDVLAYVVVGAFVVGIGGFALLFVLQGLEPALALMYSLTGRELVSYRITPTHFEIAMLQRWTVRRWPLAEISQVRTLIWHWRHGQRMPFWKLPLSAERWMSRPYGPYYVIVTRSRGLSRFWVLTPGATEAAAEEFAARLRAAAGISDPESSRGSSSDQPITRT